MTNPIEITHEISVKGRIERARAWRLEDVLVTISGGACRTARVFDSYWVEADTLPHPGAVVEQLRRVRHPPDLFMFTQRVPHSEPMFDFYYEWDNVAAVPISTHQQWFSEQISSASRRNIRGSEKKGVTVRVSPFDERYIRGIMAISNESPIRAGRPYWHYGKDFATVEREQGTYRERSTFLAAYVGDEMIGYLKLVWDRRTAAIMQVVSSLQYRDRRPNNAMLSEAVRLCAEKGVAHMLYERFVYRDKTDSSLTRFKRENGFVRIDVPTYYVPLTAKGRAVLALGMHRGLKDRVPHWCSEPLLHARDWWYARQAQRA
jgi:Acetyltransferase (GNAT) domain